MKGLRVPVLIWDHVTYYSEEDEEAFFSWLKRIRCVRAFNGKGSELHVNISRRNISNSCLRELLAISFRYDVAMGQLSQFETPDNTQWFRGNASAYWHKRVFGTSRTPVPRNVHGRRQA